MEKVKLTERDRQVLIEISQAIVDYKFHSLRRSSWQKFEQDYLPSLVEQLAQNDFTINDRNNNTFTWMIDQIVHCGVYEPGLRPWDCRRLSDTELGQTALAICRWASKGPHQYAANRTQTQFHDLFSSDQNE